MGSSLIIQGGNKEQFRHNKVRFRGEEGIIQEVLILGQVVATLSQTFRELKFSDEPTVLLNVTITSPKEKEGKTATWNALDVSKI